jgi:hypothetical protein
VELVVVGMLVEAAVLVDLLLEPLLLLCPVLRML